MKKTIALIGSAAAALMFAGVAHADNGGGYVGLSYSDGNPVDLNAWGVDGAFDLGSNIQLDAGYANIHDSAADDYNVGGHFFSRGDKWLWGGYAGYERINGIGGDVDEWTVAGQTQYYVDHTILSGNLSYSRAQVSGDDINTYQIDGDARFFANDNLTFDVGLGYGHLDSSSSGDGGFLTYGGGAEWKPDGLPISLYGNIEGFDADGGGSGSAWTVGVRYNWGGSLSDRYRNGAGLSAPRGFLSRIF